MVGFIIGVSLIALGFIGSISFLLFKKEKSFNEKASCALIAIFSGFILVMSLSFCEVREKEELINYTRYDLPNRILVCLPNGEEYNVTDIAGLNYINSHSLVKVKTTYNTFGVELSKKLAFD